MEFEQDGAAILTIAASKESAYKPYLTVTSYQLLDASNDVYAPTVPVVNAGGQTDSAASIVWTASQDNLDDTLSYVVYRNGSYLTTVTGTGFTDTGLDSARAYTYYVKAVDKAGNASAASNPVTAKLDIEAPEVSSALSLAAPDGQNGWYVHPVTVALTAEDQLSGVALTEYSLDGGASWQPYTHPVTMNQDGAYSIAYRATDNAGNVSDARTVSFRLDGTAPAIKVSVPGENSVLEDSGDMLPQFTVTDSLTGVDNSKTTVTIDTYS